MDDSDATRNLEDPLRDFMTGRACEPADEFVRVFHGLICSLVAADHGARERHAELSQVFLDEKNIGIAMTTQTGTPTEIKGQVVFRSNFLRFTSSIEAFQRTIYVQHFCQVNAAFDVYLGLLIMALKSPTKSPELRLGDSALLADAKDLVQSSVGDMYKKLKQLGLKPGETLQTKQLLQKYRQQRHLFIHGDGIVTQLYRSRYPQGCPAVGTRLPMTLKYLDEFMDFVRNRVVRMEMARRRL